MSLPSDKMANVQIPYKTSSPIEPYGLHEAWYNYGRGTNKLNFPVGFFFVGVKQESDALGWPRHIQLFGASMAAVQAYLSARLTVKAGVIIGSALG